eukprot:4456963-Karenia_brevis.AAC.1
MKQWATQENKDRKREAKERDEQAKFKKVRFSVDEEKETHESKRKEETAKEGTPDTKRRKTQEEEEENEMLKELGLDQVGRETIVDQADKLIQEIERVVEENMEEF